MCQLEEPVFCMHQCSSTFAAQSPMAACYTWASLDHRVQSRLTVNENISLNNCTNNTLLLHAFLDTVLTKLGINTEIHKPTKPNGSDHSTCGRSYVYKMCLIKFSYSLNYNNSYSLTCSHYLACFFNETQEWLTKWQFLDCCPHTHLCSTQTSNSNSVCVSALATYYCIHHCCHLLQYDDVVQNASFKHLHVFRSFFELSWAWRCCNKIYY